MSSVDPHIRLPHGAAVAAAAAAAAAGSHFGAKGLNFAASPPSLLHHSHAHIKQENSINALYDNFMTPPALSVKLA